MKNNRKNDRVPLSVKVDYTSEGTFLFEYSSNVSETGIFILSKNPLKMGTRLELQFNVPESSDVISVQGEVVWVNPVRSAPAKDDQPGMGIQFVDMNPMTREQIQSMVKRIAILE